jgi:hypothetical protein
MQSGNHPNLAPQEKWEFCNLVFRAIWHTEGGEHWNLSSWSSQTALIGKFVDLS